MANQLLVIVFEGAGTASQVRQSLRSAQGQGILHVKDAAVIIKEADGTLRADNEVSSDVKWGAGLGAGAGLMLTFMFPVVGLAIGTAAGVGIAASLGNHVDKKFVEEVKAQLTPDSSALFVIGTSEHPDAVRAVLQPYKGTLLQTTVSEELEEQIREALK